MYILKITVRAFFGLLVAILLCSGLELSAQTLFTISKDHSGKLVLPAEPNRDENDTANLINRYIKKVFGQELGKSTWSGSVPADSGSIVIGRAALNAKVFSDKDLQAMSDHGYRIRTHQNNVYIVGGKFGGCTYSVYDFLEAIGLKVFTYHLHREPEGGVLKVPALDMQFNPQYKVRMSGKRQNRAYYGNVDDKEFEAKMGYTAFWHNSVYLVNYPEYYKSNPEYYAISQKGVNAAKAYGDNFTSFIQHCYSNPEIREIAKKRLLKWVGEQSDRYVFDVGQADGSNFCYCKDCLKQDNVPGEIMTDRFLKWSNEMSDALKAKYPDKVVSGLAYLKFGAPPPKNVKMSKNTLMWLCAYTPEIGSYTHWFDHPANKAFEPWYKGWTKKYPGQVMMYDYAGYRLFQHDHMFKRLRRYADDGVVGIYFCGQPRYFFRDLWYYVSDELMWNPYKDRRKLIEEFMAFYYGPAAAKVQQIYDKIRDISIPYSRPQGIAANPNDFLTMQEFEEFIALYLEAEKLVSKDSPYHARIVKDKLTIMQHYLNSFNIGRRNLKEVGRFREVLGAYLREGGSERLKYVLDKKARRMKKWFWENARLKIDYKNFWKDKTIQALINNPESVDMKLLPEIKIVRTRRGWRIPLEKFQGQFGIFDYAYDCPDRKALNLRARGVTRAKFNLDKAPGKTALILEGQDDDSSGQTPIRVWVNGKQVFSGDCNFIEKGWSTRMWYLREHFFKAGENEIVIKNLAENADPYYRWLMLSGVWIEKKAPR